MATSTIYVVEAANLFCGEHDPSKSKHLTLAELALPTLAETFADHTPGGARFGVEFAVGGEKMEPTFKLNGFDPDLLTQFGLGTKAKKVFTAYGVVVDKVTGRNIELKATMEGRLGKVEPSAFQRGELMSHDYAINELMHYELWFDGNEKILWDFPTNVWRVDGMDENAEMNRILRIT